MKTKIYFKKILGPNGTNTGTVPYSTGTQFKKKTPNRKLPYRTVPVPYQYFVFCIFITICTVPVPVRVTDSTLPYHLHMRTYRTFDYCTNRTLK